MPKRLRLITAIAALVALLPGSGASAAPDRTIELTAKERAAWQGAATVGANLNYFDQTGTGQAPFGSATCSKSPETYCDQTLLVLSNPLTQEEIDAGKTSKSRSATATISGWAPVPGPVTDFDLLVFEADEDGNPGVEVARDGAFASESESASWSVRTSVDEPTKRYLVRVVYFLSPGSGFAGEIAF